MPALSQALLPDCATTASIVTCPSWLQPEEQDDLGEELFRVEPNFVPRDSLDMDSHQVLVSDVLTLFAAQYRFKPRWSCADSLCGCPVLGGEVDYAKLC